ncbi:outer membrane lipoprotein carrier protein LolA [Streptomyces capparidis]
MAGIRPTTQEPDPLDETRSLRRRRTVRLLVPVAVAGMAAGTIGLVPAIADSGGSDPELPRTTAAELLADIAGSKVDTFSGSVRVSADLGLPGLIAGGATGGAFGGGGEDDGADAAGADPSSRLAGLLAGSHTLRVAADGPDRQRVSIVEETSEYTVIRNGGEVWAYDSAANQVFHADGERAAKDAGRGATGRTLPGTPREAAEEALKAVDPTTSVTVDGTSRVAGQDAYDLLIKPRQADSTVGEIRIAVDADNGAPLKFTLTPKGSGKAAVDIGFTDVDFDAPDAKDFSFTPPKGAKVTEADELADRAPDRSLLDGLSAADLRTVGEGWNTVARIKLPAGLLGGEAFGGKDAPEGFDPQALLDSLGSSVKGEFGTGRVITSRLVNVLITDDGVVYAGAVSKDALVTAANGE